MPRELDPKEIEDLALKRVGGRIYGKQGVHTRILAAGPHLEPKPLGSLH